MESLTLLEACLATTVRHGSGWCDGNVHGARRLVRLVSGPLGSRRGMLLCTLSSFVPANDDARGDERQQLNDRDREDDASDGNDLLPQPRQNVALEVSD